MRSPFILDPKASKSDLKSALGDKVTEAFYLIDAICSDGVNPHPQLLWTLHGIVEQAKEISVVLDP